MDEWTRHESILVLVQIPLDAPVEGGLVDECWAIIAEGATYEAIEEAATKAIHEGKLVLVVETQSIGLFFRRVHQVRSEQEAQGDPDGGGPWS